MAAANASLGDLRTWMHHVIQQHIQYRALILLSWAVKQFFSRFSLILSPCFKEFGLGKLYCYVLLDGSALYRANLRYVGQSVLTEWESDIFSIVQSSLYKIMHNDRRSVKNLCKCTKLLSRFPIHCLAEVLRSLSCWCELRVLWYLHRASLITQPELAKVTKPKIQVFRTSHNVEW